MGFLWDKLVLHADDDEGKELEVCEDGVAVETTSLIQTEPKARRRSSLVALKAELPTRNSVTNKMLSASIMGDGNHATPIVMPVDRTSTMHLEDLINLFKEDEEA